ncbi:MAG: hypothetical protein COB36_10160 [Alphaproteobacteria bacterium]|nr:MAG: hypothetical protein COB36_10160 [Alphaproteobacteria bacterium]
MMKICNLVKKLIKSNFCEKNNNLRNVFVASMVTSSLVGTMMVPQAFAGAGEEKIVTSQKLVQNVQDGSLSIAMLSSGRSNPEGGDVVTGSSKSVEGMNNKMTDNKVTEIPKDLDPAEADFNIFKSPFYLIAHADFKYHEDLDKAVAKLGVDRATYRLLTLLTKRSPINIKELASLALLKRSTASRALVRLKKEGWITQYPDEKDSRITIIELTDSGRELAGKIMEISSRQLHRAAQGLDNKQMHDLTRLLQYLVDNLSKSPIE